MKRLILLVLTGSLVFLLTGCFFTFQSAPSDRLIYQILQTNDIQVEIKNREDLTDPDNENHFALAVLYTHPRNQTPDYQAAESHLAEYLVNLPPENQDWQARYIDYLLQRINAIDEEIGRTQKQLESESTGRRSYQTRYKADHKKLKTVRAALKQSEKKSNQLWRQLKKAQKRSAKSLSEQKRLQIENEELKKQLKKLSDLYLDLERKRQVMQ